MNQSDDARLDALLAGDRVAAPAPALVDGIVACAALPDAAPPNTRAPLAAGWGWQRLGWLWPGAGLAGVGVAGSFAGALAVSFALRVQAPPPALDWPERLTAFAEPVSEGSEE